MFEVIVLQLGSGLVLIHTGCRLQASAEQAVRRASFDVAWTAPGLPCSEDEPCTVTVSGELWLTGYVRDVNPSHDEGSRRYSVEVVSATVDATESAIDHPSGYRENCDLKEIGEEFDTDGIGIICDIATEKKALHQIRPGETLFQTLEPEARANGALIYDTPEGKLKIADQPEGRHAGALVRGVNIKRASGTLSGRFNYSEVRVRGQSSYGTTGAALSPQAKASGTANRPRRLIIYHEGDITSERAKKRAAWEAKRAAGKGKAARITTPGCRDGAGRLWTRNFLVPVTDDWIGLDQDMVIASLTLDQDATGGTQTDLELKDPRALGGENPRGGSAEGWAVPEADDESFEEQ